MDYSVCVDRGASCTQNTVDLDAQKEHHSSSDLRRAIHSRDDHDYCASRTVEKHVSSVGGGMKKYFFRELSRSRCEEET